MNLRRLVMSIVTLAVLVGTLAACTDRPTTADDGSAPVATTTTGPNVAVPAESWTTSTDVATTYAPTTVNARVELTSFPLGAQRLVGQSDAWPIAIVDDGRVVVNQMFPPRGDDKDSAAGTCSPQFWVLSTDQPPALLLDRRRDRCPSRASFDGRTLVWSESDNAYAIHWHIWAYDTRTDRQWEVADWSARFDGRPPGSLVVGPTVADGWIVWSAVDSLDETWVGSTFRAPGDGSGPAELWLPDTTSAVASNGGVTVRDCCRPAPHLRVVSLLTGESTDLGQLPDHTGSSYGGGWVALAGEGGLELLNVATRERTTLIADPTSQWPTMSSSAVAWHTNERSYVASLTTRTVTELATRTGAAHEVFVSDHFVAFLNNKYVDQPADDYSWVYVVAPLPPG